MVEMRTLMLVCVLSLPVGAQSQPTCTGITLDVDARCSCIKDPKSMSCELFKKGFYDGKMKVGEPAGGWVGSNNKVAAPAAKARQARVVPLPSKDYLRFLHPNAFLAAGFDLEKLFRTPEVMQALLGMPDDQGKLAAALAEMDHLWMSMGSATDGVVLMTGKFEKGAAAGMFYAQGVMPVFLGDAHAMMIGPEPSIQAALARMAKPAAGDGWVAKRARELSKDHETWLVMEPPANRGENPAAVFEAIRKFALGIRVSGEASIDGEAVTESGAGAEKIAAWVEQIKGTVREKTGVGALDSLKVSVDGATLRFSAKDDGLLTGDAGKKAMSSDFGVELYGLIMAGFPGMPARTASEDKILAIRKGMKREEVLTVAGAPLSVAAIQGLDEPRETWTYQVPFGKQFSVRLDNGVVTRVASSQ